MKLNMSNTWENHVWITTKDKRNWEFRIFPEAVQNVVQRSATIWQWCFVKEIIVVVDTHLFLYFVLINNYDSDYTLTFFFVLVETTVTNFVYWKNIGFLTKNLFKYVPDFAHPAFYQELILSNTTCFICTFENLNQIK